MRATLKLVPQLPVERDPVRWRDPSCGTSHTHNTANRVRVPPKGVCKVICGLAEHVARGLLERTRLQQLGGRWVLDGVIG